MADNIYNIYCDESRIENPEFRHMVIGALEIPRIRKESIALDLKNIYKNHEFKHELKWTDVHYKYAPFYKSLVDYFISTPDISFRCIIVDKSMIKLEEFHENDRELAFFKFYYLMLRKKLLSNNGYYIFLDKKPTRDRHRARALHHYLDSYIYWNKEECNIKHFQAIESGENVFIQLADFFVGLMGFASNNEDDTVSAKGQIVQYLKQTLQRGRLCSTSSLDERKYNVFVWKGKA